MVRFQGLGRRGTVSTVTSDGRPRTKLGGPDGRGLRKSWVASVWRATTAVPDDPDEVPAPEDPKDLLGSAVLIDAQHLLTCRHVSRAEPRGTAGGRLLVRFPFAGAGRWHVVHAVGEVDDGGPLDVALLQLEAPVDQAPAIVQSVGPEQLTGTWRAHGFPIDDRDATGRNRGKGYAVDGVLDGPIGNGALDLHTTSDRAVVPGFSGTGLWSDEHDAVVAIIDTVDGDRPTAIPVAEAVEHLHRSTVLRTVAERMVHYIDDADWRAWNLRADPAYEAHFGPRSRGVTRHDQKGHLFRGRHTELTTITTWQRDWRHDHRTLVVTGSPGTGKSAIMGRIVTTADPVLRLQVRDDGVMAPAGSITIAVHASGKTVYDVAEKVAQATRASAATQPHELGAAIAAAHPSPDRPVTVLIDAVDEAQDPHRIMNEIVMPLQAAGSVTGSPRVLVGTRRADTDHRPLFRPDDARLLVIDLDDDPDGSGRRGMNDDGGGPGSLSSHSAAVTEYVVAILRARMTGLSPGIFMDPDSLRPLAARIARASGNNFLIASLVAEHHAAHGASTTEPASPHDPDTAGAISIETALETYLDGIPGVAGISARDLLGILAFARTPGMPATLWHTAVLALLPDQLDNTPDMISPSDLDTFAASDGTAFLLTTASDESGPVYRLYHQELIDTLLKAYP